MSYLLRLWREETEGQTGWRASLERSRTAKRRVFANLDGLFEYLQRQTSAAVDVDGDDEEITTGC